MNSGVAGNNEKNEKWGTTGGGKKCVQKKRRKKEGTHVHFRGKGKKLMGGTTQKKKTGLGCRNGGKLKLQRTRKVLVRGGQGPV